MNRNKLVNEANDIYKLCVFIIEQVIRYTTAPPGTHPSRTSRDLTGALDFTIIRISSSNPIITSTGKESYVLPKCLRIGASILHFSFV